jgi:NAD+ kinase
MKKTFSKIVVVAKETPYEQYLRKKAQGKAPVALRWERLRNRYETHKECVIKVQSVLKKLDVNFSIVHREEMHRGTLSGVDLVIAVGGDGTTLNSSSFLDDNIPILGINSDPTKPEEEGVLKLKDERRSTGALCAVTADNVKVALPLIIGGEIPTRVRTRLQCMARGHYTETRLPAALNDILIAHPCPASVSRFRLDICNGKVTPAFERTVRPSQVSSINVWSSGVWISTSVGSSAAMYAAGGTLMDRGSSDLQYMVREHLLEQGQHKDKGHGIIDSTKMINIRWNSQQGCIYVDGQHLTHSLELGDEISIDCHAPPLHLFDAIDVNEALKQL